MAEAYIRLFSVNEIFVESAGIEPGVLNPRVVTVLQEDGIEIAGKKTQSVFALHEAGNRYDFVITVCSDEAKEQCPIFPGGGKHLHWPFPDPSALSGASALDQTREIRNMIRVKVQEFVGEQDL